MLRFIYFLFCLISIFYATPPSKNFSIIKKALFYKKNIFLEKPGFNKISDFDKIKKLQFNNDELRRTNSELNIMDTLKLKKIILLQHKIYELEGGQIVRRKNKTNK